MTSAYMIKKSLKGIKRVKDSVHNELQKYNREECTTKMSSMSPHRINIFTEGYKSTVHCLKGRLPWHVKVISLTDIRHFSDLNEHELFQHLTEEPPRRHP